MLAPRWDLTWDGAPALSFRTGVVLVAAVAATAVAAARSSFFDSLHFSTRLTYHIHPNRFLTLICVGIDKSPLLTTEISLFKFAKYLINEFRFVSFANS